MTKGKLQKLYRKLVEDAIIWDEGKPICVTSDMKQILNMFAKKLEEAKKEFPKYGTLTDAPFQEEASFTTAVLKWFEKWFGAHAESV